MPAGKAKPSPRIGQALGPLGLNIAEVCKRFNERVNKDFVDEVPLRVLLTAYEDRTYDMKISMPTASYFLLKAAGLEKGSRRPGHDVVGTVDVRQVYEIAKIKQKEEHMTRVSLESVARSIAASARSMGLKVVK